MNQPDEKTACRKKVDAKKATSITMPKRLQEAIVRAAIREDRSFSSVVRQAVEKYVGA